MLLEVFRCFPRSGSGVGRSKPAGLPDVEIYQQTTLKGDQNNETCRLISDQVFRTGWDIAMVSFPTGRSKIISNREPRQSKGKKLVYSKHLFFGTSKLTIESLASRLLYSYLSFLPTLMGILRWTRRQGRLCRLVGEKRIPAFVLKIDDDRCFKKYRKESQNVPLSRLFLNSNVYISIDRVSTGRGCR